MKKATAAAGHTLAHDSEFRTIRDDWVDSDTASDLMADICIDELPESHARGYELLTAIHVHFEMAEGAVIAHVRDAVDEAIPVVEIIVVAVGASVHPGCWSGCGSGGVAYWTR